MSKILVLNGSPRGERGNTWKLIKSFLLGYQKEDNEAQVQYINLHKYDIKSCLGCFSCWGKTAGKCIHRDDMDELLPLYLSSDIIIWASPLYHHGMTSILKRFVERTLPVSLPYIIKKESVFGHPERWTTVDKKNILISTCGFPEHHNFDILKQSFARIANGGIDASILCVMGELLSKQALLNKTKWYFDLVEHAGLEFARAGQLSVTTLNQLTKPLVEVESFIDMANMSWDAAEEIPPTIDEAMGRMKPHKSESVQTLKGLNQLKLMKHSFNKEAARNCEGIIEIEFSDVNETYYFTLSNQECHLEKGKSDDFTTKIITPLEIWKKISTEELNPSQAMIDGLYKVEGDMNLLMKMGQLFAGEVTDNQTNEGINNPKIMGLRANKWMSISFIPWIISWLSISNTSLFGIFIPLLMTLGILSIKVKSSAVTYFEKMSVLYFLLIAIIYSAGIEIITFQGVLINYFSIAVIWFLSILDGQPLTADYSKYEIDEAMRENVIFLKTNANLTVFWSIIFIVQGAMFYLLHLKEMTRLAPFLYLLTVLALFFTKWYASWYPEQVIRGN